MDIRTGRTYETLGDALKDGVPISDVAEVRERANKTPRVKFRKHRPFASFKNTKNSKSGVLRRGRW